MNKIKWIIFSLTICLNPFFILSQKKVRNAKLSPFDKIKFNYYIRQSKKAIDPLSKTSYADSALDLAKQTTNNTYTAKAAYAKANGCFSLKQYSQAMDYYQKALRLFQTLNDRKNLLKLNFDMGLAYYRLNDMNKSFEHYNKSLNLAYSAYDTLMIIKNLSGIATMYRHTDKFNDARKYYLKILEISKQANQTSYILSSLNNLGTICRKLGNHSDALNFYNEALELIPKTKAQKKKALFLNNIGLIYKDRGKSKTALKYFTDALKWAKKYNFIYGLAYSYGNIGSIDLQNGEYERALAYFDSALVNYLQEERKKGMALTYRNIGDSYFAMKNYNKAITYYLKSVKTAKEIDNKHHLALALLNLAKAYYENKDYALSSNILNECQQISIAQNYENILKNTYLLLSKLAEVSNKPKIALEYYKKYFALKDSILNEKTNKQLAEIQAKYDLDKKELLLSKQQIKLRQQVIQKYSLAAIVLLLVIFVIYAYLARKKLKQKNAILSDKYLKIEQQKREIEKINRQLTELSKLKELNTQMLVHDLKNPLNNIISACKIKNSPDEQNLYESSQYMLNLVENILSYTQINNTGFNISLNTVNLQDVIAEAYRNTDFLFNNKGVFFINKIDKTVKVLSDAKILQRIFINLFTNAVRFTPSGGKITIDYEIVENKIKITFSDTGIGIKNERLKNIFDIYQYDNISSEAKYSSTGIGLFFIKKAIEAHHEKISVNSTPGKGTTFTFYLKVLEIDHHKPVNTIKQNHNLPKLTEEEKKILKNITRQLKTKELYEVSDIKAILKNIKFESPNIKLWTELVNKCLMNLNTQNYIELINIVEN